METRNIFISCTTRDLLQYRVLARQIISKVNDVFHDRFELRYRSMDNQFIDGELSTPVEDSRKWVQEADWIILIVAWNYGCVPPGSDCSVTEAEYREAILGKKKVFVYLAGEAGDSEHLQYRALPKHIEEKNLDAWRGAREGREHEAALDKFKSTLRQGRFELFQNIDDFRIKLNGALTQKLIRELFQTLGPQIVALGLQPPLSACIKEVQLLARLKRLHDRLHIIRQFGIRKWRETLLPCWAEKGLPPRDAERSYDDSARQVSRFIGEISGLADALPADVKKTLARIQLVGEYSPPRIEKDNRAEFVESIETFASRVQGAFTGCNNEMKNSGARLERLFERLARSVQTALSERQVWPDRQQAIQGELQRATQIYARLQQALLNHGRWQKLHDEMELVDGYIKSHEPRRGRKKISDGASADDVSRRDVDQLQFRIASKEIVETDGVEMRSLLDAAGAEFTEENSQRLQAWPALVLRAREHLNTFVATVDINSYQAMRNAFDDLFFAIDKETLYTVEASESHVTAMEAGLSVQQPE